MSFIKLPEPISDITLCHQYTLSLATLSMGDFMIKLRTFLIAAFTVFVILLVFILSLITGRHSTREIEGEIGQSLSGIAYQMSDKLDHFMWSRAGEIEMLTSLGPVQHGDPEEIQTLLEQLKASFPSFSWVGYLNHEGTVTASTGGILKGENIAERPVFKEGIKGKFIGDVHEAVLLSKLLPNPTGEPLQFVDISMPVIGSDGQTTGVLAAHLSWEWSKEVQRTILAPQLDHTRDMELFIISKTDGTVLLGPDGMVGHPLSIDSMKQAQAGKNGWELVNWPDGKRYLTGYAFGDGYLNYEGLGWTVLVRQPEAVALSPVQELRNYFIFTGIIACVLFALLGAMLAERLSRPIRELTKSADRLRAGDTIVIPQDRTFQELYSLSASLRSLVDSLSKTESALGDMKTLAHSDQLTGLPNRVALEGYLERTLPNLEPSEHKLAFLYIDLDGFKTVNDSLGHQAGDLLLQKVAQRIASLTKPGGLAVRLGGDEFLLLSPVSPAPAAALKETEDLGNELIALLNQPFVIELQMVSIGCSIGAAFYPDHGIHPTQIIQSADEALYRSKLAGKNRITFTEIPK